VVPIGTSLTVLKASTSKPSSACGFRFQQFVEIEITCIYSPFCFYAQLKHFKEDFSRFEESIQTFYENEMKHSDIVLLKKPCVGQMCIARYSVDDFWYRAVVKEIDLTLNSVVVFFIDYGNHDTVQIDGNLLVINEQFIKYFWWF
jgi:tudor domain-containing protein 1/4/6/7